MLSAFSSIAAEKKTVTLSAASMFDKDHPFTQTYIKFEELVNKYQDEVKVELKYSLNKALGIESDYLRFMSQGESVDLAIISPSHIAQRAPRIAIVDMPLLRITSYNVCYTKLLRLLLLRRRISPSGRRASPSLICPCSLRIWRTATGFSKARYLRISRPI